MLVQTGLTARQSYMPTTFYLTHLESSSECQLAAHGHIQPPILPVWHAEYLRFQKMLISVITDHAQSILRVIVISLPTPDNDPKML